MKHIFLLFAMGLLSLSVLRAQLLPERTYAPWPFDTIGTYEHNTEAPAPDSTLTQLQVFSVNPSEYVEQVIDLRDSSGTDTMAIRSYFRDENQQDTLEMQVVFVSGNPVLSMTTRRTYFPNGKLDSLVQENFETNPPYALNLRDVIQYDTAGNELSSYLYQLGDSTLELSRYELNEFENDRVISYTYSTFGILSSPILRSRTTRNLSPTGMLMNVAFYFRIHPDSSLTPFDSLNYHYDVQGWLVKNDRYIGQADGASWLLYSQDTLEYFTGEQDYQTTRFLVESDTTRPRDRFRTLFSDTLAYYSVNFWEDSCQCWQVVHEYRTNYDELGRQSSYFGVSYSAPNDTAFLNEIQYLYYGESSFLKYYRSFVLFSPDFPPSVFSFTYSLRDGITSIPLAPLSLDLHLYPNPSTGRVYLQYPAGQVASLRIFQPDGREVLQKSLNRSGLWQGDLSHLPAGMYYIEVRTDEQRGIKPLILTN